jgi:hypothetical protein
MGHRTIRSPVNIYVKEGEVALTFGLCAEQNALQILFRWFRKSFSLSGPCGQMMKVSSK